MGLHRQCTGSSRGIIVEYVQSSAKVFARDSDGATLILENEVKHQSFFWRDLACLAEHQKLTPGLQQLDGAAHLQCRQASLPCGKSLLAIRPGNADEIGKRPA